MARRWMIGECGTEAVVISRAPRGRMTDGLSGSPDWFPTMKLRILLATTALIAAASASRRDRSVHHCSATPTTPTQATSEIAERDAGRAGSDDEREPDLGRQEGLARNLSICDEVESPAEEDDREHPAAPASGRRHAGPRGERRPAPMRARSARYYGESGPVGQADRVLSLRAVARSGQVRRHPPRDRVRPGRSPRPPRR